MVIFSSMLFMLVFLLIRGIVLLVCMIFVVFVRVVFSVLFGWKVWKFVVVKLCVLRSVIVNVLFMVIIKVVEVVGVWVLV